MVLTIGLTVISWLALAGFTGLVVLFLAYLSDKTVKSKFIARFRSFVAPRAYSIGFLLSLTATMASLFLSEIIHFQPCVLCWYQRIAMYPLPLLFYIALMRGERTVSPYLIALNIFGLAVALYHYSLHVLPRTLVPLLPCSKAVGGVPCDKGYELYFGFMTFPFMAAVVFALILVVLLVSPAKSQKK